MKKREWEQNGLKKRKNKIIKNYLEKEKDLIINNNCK